MKHSVKWLINNRNSFLTILKAGKFKIKVPVDLVSEVNTFPLCRWLSFCYVFTQCKQSQLAFLPFQTRGPPPGALPHPGIEPRSLALQADSLPSEPPGNNVIIYLCACWSVFSIPYLNVNSMADGIPFSLFTTICLIPSTHLPDPQYMFNIWWLNEYIKS